MDEPFSGFDPINANLIKDEILRLREKGSTIIFSTHRMESVEEMCDYIALINKSEKILDGEKAKIKNDFKSNQYTLVHRGNGISTSDAYNLENKKELGEGLIQSTLKLPEGISSNQLLQELINQKVDIVSFQEEIPSINDIFIQLVKGDKQNIPTS